MADDLIERQELARIIHVAVYDELEWKQALAAADAVADALTAERERAEKAEAERDRLREALRAIVGTVPWPDPDMGYVDLARAALHPEAERDEAIRSNEAVCNNYAKENQRLTNKLADLRRRFRATECCDD